MDNTAAAPSIPNAVTRTVICVNTIEEADFSGLLHNPYLPEPVAFGQVKDIVNTLEDFFNRISYPQSYFEDRSFLNDKDKPEPAPKKDALLQRYRSDEELSRCRGEVATFEIEVRFRKNATWQGTLTWLETKETCPFRSTLEMLKLIDSAILQKTLNLD